MEHKFFFKNGHYKLTKFVNALGIEFFPQNMHLLSNLKVKSYKI